MKIVPVTTRCHVEIDEKRFLDLLDSESYVTGNAAYCQSAKPLSEKLEALVGISEVDYDGHFGAAIHFTIDADADHDKIVALIEPVINEHLDWCASLPKAAHVIARRKA